MRLLAKLREHARQRPREVAVQQIIPASGVALTWAQLEAAVDALRQDLERHLPGNAVVLLCSNNRPAYTAGFLATLAAKMTLFPVATDISGPELRSAAERSGAAALLAIDQPALSVGDSFARQVELSIGTESARLHLSPAWTTRFALGPALLLLSSGTTGRPKIVRRDGAALDAVSAAMVSSIGWQASDRVLAATPLCHSYGMEHGLLCPTWAGSTALLFDRLDLLAALDQLAGSASPPATIFPGVPFMFEMLVRSASAPAVPLALRRAYSAGGPLPLALFEAFSSRFAVPLAQLYGATEIGSVCFNDPLMAPFDPAAVGRPMEGVSLRILDPAAQDIDAPLPSGVEGHVAVAAESMLSGYLDGEAAPLRGGYFLTGDLGKLSAHGALTITGRIKLLIDVAGRKVNPLEVEQVICGHSAVGECVVVPLRMSQTLNRLKAILTPAQRGGSVDMADLRQFVKNRLSAYKVPREYELRDALPRSPAGKVLRQALQDES